MRLAYLATHYPYVSHTFIQGELLALEAGGVEVVRTALNRPGEADLRTDLDRAEAARTWHVKATTPARAAIAVGAISLRHPVAVLRALRRAMRAGGTDLAAVVKQVLQLVEALLLWRHCRRRGVRSIHAHFGQAPATVARAAAAFGTDVGPERWTWSVTIHGWHEFVTEDTSGLRPKLLDADLVVAISDFTRAQLLRIAPEARERIHVVRCGLDLDSFRPRSSPPGGGADGVPEVVVVARLSPEKGHRVLFEAMAALAADGVELRARVVGDGPSRADLEAAVASLGLGDAVRFEGALAPAEVAAALREADAFCLPTFAEGLPVSIMEAMAVGTPVVTTSISGIPELVIDGETGWVVPAGNAELLAGALRAATAGGPDVERVVAAAGERVRARHDRATNVPQLAKLLAEAHGR